MKRLLAALSLTAPLVIAQSDAGNQVVLACKTLLSDDNDYDLIVMWDRAEPGEATTPGYLVSTFGESEYYFYKEPDGNLRGISVDDDNFQIVVTSKLGLLQYDFRVTDDDGKTGPDSIRTCRTLPDDEISTLRDEARIP